MLVFSARFQISKALDRIIGQIPNLDKSEIRTHDPLPSEQCSFASDLEYRFYLLFNLFLLIEKTYGNLYKAPAGPDFRSDCPPYRGDYSLHREFGYHQSGDI